MTAGQVWAHVGQPFTAQEFGVVVVGAGRMGAACALYLRRLAPEVSLLMVEEGGLPNEEGATILAPGVWTTLDLPPGKEEAARWTRQALAEFGDTQFQDRPVVELSETARPGSGPSHEVQARWPELAGLFDPGRLPFARVDGGAATYRPGSVALRAAQQAIGLGANLMLNARARPTPTGVTLERLTVTNTHQIVTHETVNVRAQVTVIAAGAAGHVLAEHSLGRHTRHGQAYRQYPRLNLPSSDATPTLRADGLTLRPQQGGFTLVPRLHHRDPHGYLPAGGHLTGVPTGLRREVLEDLVGLMDALPALAGEELQVGHSLSDIPGAWVALPHGDPAGAPLWEEVSPQHFLLLGGPHADTLGLAAAHALAAEVARRLTAT